MRIISILRNDQECGYDPAEVATCLVEVNDGYSLGSYGLFHIHYAKLLSARWSKRVGPEDLCNY